MCAFLLAESTGTKIRYTIIMLTSWHILRKHHLRCANVASFSPLQLIAPISVLSGAQSLQYSAHVWMTLQKTHGANENRENIKGKCRLLLKLTILSLRVQFVATRGYYIMLYYRVPRFNPGRVVKSWTHKIRKS